MGTTFGLFEVIFSDQGLGSAGGEGKNEELPLYGAGNPRKSEHLIEDQPLLQNGVNMVLWRMEVEPHDRDDQVPGVLVSLWIPSILKFLVFGSRYLVLWFHLKFLVLGVLVLPGVSCFWFQL